MFCYTFINLDCINRTILAYMVKSRMQYSLYSTCSSIAVASGQSFHYFFFYQRDKAKFVMGNFLGDLNITEKMEFALCI